MCSPEPYVLGSGKPLAGTYSTWGCDLDHEEGTVFMNNVDSYTGRHITDYLSHCLIGSTVLLEDEDDDDVSIRSASTPLIECYKVIGTLTDYSADPPVCLRRVMRYTTAENMAKELCRFPTLIFDTTQDYSQLPAIDKVVDHLMDMLQDTQIKRTFIMLSTVMTWARSKLPDPDDLDMPFSEEDYRSREPHPRYRAHFNMEKKFAMLRKQNPNVNGYIVCCGVVYGMEEGMLYPWFRAAWQNVSVLNYYNSSHTDNVIPTIYIKDLTQIIHNIVDNRPKNVYFLGVDGVHVTQKAMVRVISRALGSGRTQRAPIEEAMMTTEWTQVELDHLLLNMYMDPGMVRDQLNVVWTHDDGILGMTRKLAVEFRHGRKLQPMKVALHGPPGVGKTTIAEQLCESFNLHLVSVENIVEDEKKRLREIVSLALQSLTGNHASPVSDLLSESGEDPNRDDDMEDMVEDAKLALEDIETSLDENDGIPSIDLLIRLVQMKLMTNPCQNQGFVLDGFPSSADHAKILFTPVVEEEHDEEGMLTLDHIDFNSKFMPDIVFDIHATDEFVKHRILNLEEKDVAGNSRNTEEEFIKRLIEYHHSWNESNLISYYEDMGVPVHFVRVDQERHDQMRAVTMEIAYTIGEPRDDGTGKALGDAEERKRRAEEKRAGQERKDHEEKLKAEMLAADRKEELRKYYRDIWSAQQQAELERVDNMAEPLCQYLQKHVLPVLTEAVLSCVMLRPPDPLDYLAEYLYQNNPGTMLPTFQKEPLKSSSASQQDSKSDTLSGVSGPQSDGGGSGDGRRSQ